jgi:hypothetical protein
MALCEITSPSSVPPDDPFLRAIWRSLPGEETDAEVFAKLGYTPTPRQAELHAATEWDVLFGGAAGGGKTKSAVADDLKDAVRYPGIRIGAFRRTYGELEESLLAELAEFRFGAALGADWNGTRRELKFPNGSLIRYGYLESLKDATRRQGGQYQKVTFDERTLILPTAVSFVYSRIRSGRPEIPVIGVRSYANPGGAGHGETRRRFIVPTNYGAKTYVDEQGRSVRFIPAKLADNPHLNPEYERTLDALPPQWRAAFKDGNWDTFVGQYFPEWDHDRHVTPVLPLVPAWRRAAGIDWGYAAPWCVLWGAVDEDGRLWIYREVYKTLVGETEQARRIASIEVAAREHVIHHADPSMWARRGEPSTIADTYAMAGVGLLPADNQRVAGWQRVHSYLGEAPACRYHRAKGWTTCPRVHVFETCENLIRTLPDQVHDETHVEDLDTDGEDHAVDAARYLIMGIAQAPAPLAENAHSRPDRRREEIDYMALDGGVPVNVGEVGF